MHANTIRDKHIDTLHVDTYTDLINVSIKYLHVKSGHVYIKDSHIKYITLENGARLSTVGTEVTNLTVKDNNYVNCQNSDIKRLQVVGTDAKLDMTGTIVHNLECTGTPGTGDTDTVELVLDKVAINEVQVSHYHLCGQLSECEVNGGFLRTCRNDLVLNDTQWSVDHEEYVDTRYHVVKGNPNREETHHERVMKMAETLMVQGSWVHLGYLSVSHNPNLPHSKPLSEGTILRETINPNPSVTNGCGLNIVWKKYHIPEDEQQGELYQALVPITAQLVVVNGSNWVRTNVVIVGKQVR